MPEASFAQPLDGANGEPRAAIAWRDIDRTADALGRAGRAWKAVVRPLAEHLDGVVDFTGNQLIRMPRHPVTTARFGLRALELGTSLGRRTFATEDADALFAGVVAHAHVPDGWAYPRGGAQSIADALLADLRAHGGVVRTDTHVTSLATPA